MNVEKTYEADVTEVGAEYHRRNIDTIRTVLEKTDIHVQRMVPSKGMCVTSYEAFISVKCSKRWSLLQNKLEAALGVFPIRVDPPTSDLPTLHIEIPNPARQTYEWTQAIREKQDPTKVKRGLPAICVAYDTDGEPFFAKPDHFPHLLVTGEKGTGKTTCLRSLILSMAHKSGPNELKFVLIDPTGTELGAFKGLLHLAMPVITERKQALTVLKELADEMERRYERMREETEQSSRAEDIPIRSISDYNEREGVEPMVRYAVVIDGVEELLCGEEGRELKEVITVLLQKSRAAGIFLFLSATRLNYRILSQRLLLNIPSRISFRQPTRADAIRAMDQEGAEKLCGAGDMLLYQVGMQRAIRAQCPNCTEEDVAAFCTACEGVQT